MTIFKGRKALIALLATVMITAISFCGLMSFARANVNTVGTFVVTGGVNNVDYTYASNVLTIKTATSLTIANTNPSSATDVIQVADGVDANITLAGVNIDVSSLNLTSDTKWVQDFKGNNILIFTSEWNINWALDKNEGLILEDFSKN